MFAASYSALTRANSNNGNGDEGGIVTGEEAVSALQPNGFIGAWAGTPIPPQIHQLGGGNVDVNGNGNANDAFYSPHNSTATLGSLQSKRLGLNASAEAYLGSGFTISGSGFFDRLVDYERNNSLELYSEERNGATFIPLVSQNTGATVIPFGAPKSSAPQEFYTTQVYQRWPGDVEDMSSVRRNHSVARNFHLKLDYDNGGPFTGSLRFISASAARTSLFSSLQFDNANGEAWPNVPADAAPPGTYIVPGGTVVFNPGGQAPNTIPMIVDTTGRNLAFTVPSALQTMLNNPNNYQLRSVASNGNSSERTGMNVARADGHYRFFGGVGPFSHFRLDFGVRSSIRSASNTDFNYLAPLWAGNGASDPSGCLVLYKSPAAVLSGGGVAGACTAGDSRGFFRYSTYAGVRFDQLPDIVKNNAQFYTGLGGTSGIRVLGLNPEAQDNPLAFQNALFPGEVANMNPAASWNLLYKQRSGYVQADFAGSVGGIGYSGNVGARMVHTNLDVTQFVSGGNGAYGAFNAPHGTHKTLRAYNDFLPAINLAFDLTKRLKLRAAYSKNMMPLNLNEWGGGLSLNYTIQRTSGNYDVSGGSTGGNPDLKPWRSDNYNLSLEYYLPNSGIVSLAGFYIKVQSFINSGTVLSCGLPNLNGTINPACVPISGPVQGEGKSLRGAAMDYQQGFTFLPGILSSTGVNLNFTYSPSNGGGKDLAGRTIPFQQDSKYSGNLILWYDDGRVNARIAGNYRSSEAISENVDAVPGLEEYQAPTVYVDASVSYKLNRHVQIFAQGENLTGEHERFYLVWPNQVFETVNFEKRYMVGARIKF